MNDEAPVRCDIGKFLNQSRGPAHRQLSDFLCIAQPEVDVGRSLGDKGIVRKKFARQLFVRRFSRDSGPDPVTVALLPAERNLKPVGFGKPVLKNQQRPAARLPDYKILHSVPGDITWYHRTAVTITVRPAREPGNLEKPAVTAVQKDPVSLIS